MLCVMGNKKENDFEGVVGEICSSIRVNFKVGEVVKKVFVTYSAKARKRICAIYNI